MIEAKKLDQTAVEMGFVRALVVENEAAQIAVSEMEIIEILHGEGSSLFYGVHPEHGHLVVVVPPMGDGMFILPFASHSS